MAACVLALGAAGCNADGLDLRTLEGTYAVMIASGGASDPNRMTATLGSGDTLLLNFTFGITQLRCQPSGTRLNILPQTAEVQHSTGSVTGLASGGGTIDPQGQVDLTLDMNVSSTGGDGGSATDGGAGQAASYRITGSRI